MTVPFSPAIELNEYLLLSTDRSSKSGAIKSNCSFGAFTDIK
jgi:hypothetical protein